MHVIHFYRSSSLIKIVAFVPSVQAYQRLQIQQQMMQAQRNVSGPIRQQEQQVSQQVQIAGTKTFGHSLHGLNIQD